MNVTLSLPEEIAQLGKIVAARQGKSLSGWFREQIEREAENITVQEIEKIDSATAAAIGMALPLEEHWDDLRWRALAEKHLR